MSVGLVVSMAIVLFVFNVVASRHVWTDRRRTKQERIAEVGLIWCVPSSVAWWPWPYPLTRLNAPDARVGFSGVPPECPQRPRGRMDPARPRDALVPLSNGRMSSALLIGLGGAVYRAAMFYVFGAVDDYLKEKKERSVERDTGTRAEAADPAAIPWEPRLGRPDRTGEESESTDSRHEGE